MALLFLLLTQSIWGANLLVDGTAAQVGGQLITVQDAYFYRSLMRFRDGAGDPLQVEGAEALRKTVQKMAFEVMVFSEIKTLQFDGGSRTEVTRLLQKRRQGKGARLFSRILSSYGRTDKEAVDLLWKSVQVERFLQKKVETLTPIITQKEIEQYYSQNKERFKGNDLDKLRSNIEVLLKKERMRKSLEEWIRFLRDKYGVTNHLAG